MSNIDREREHGVRLMRAVWRGRWWIIGTTLAAFLVAFAAVGFGKPRYTSAATVQLVDQGDHFAQSGQDATPAHAPVIEPGAVEAQVRLITSRDVARQAIGELGLLGNPEFDPLAAGLSPATRFLVWLGVARDPRRLSPEDRVLNAYFDRLAVHPDIGARVLRIEFSSGDPELAAKAANVIGERYLQMQEQARKEAAKAADDGPARSYEALKTKVSDAEGKLDAFRAEAGRLIGTPSTSTQQIADLSAQIAAARTAQLNAQSKVRRIREMLRQGRPEEIPEIASDEQIRGIALQTVSLRAEFDVESRTLLPGHPRLRELRAALVNDDNELGTVAQQIARNIEGEARAAGARVDALATLMNAQQRALAAGEAAQAKLRALEHDAAAARDQLASFLEKYPEASASRSDGPAAPGLSFVSRAVAPRVAASRQKTPTLIGGTLAGFLLSFCFVVGREFLVGSRPVEQSTGVALRSLSGGSVLTQIGATPDLTQIHAPPDLARINAASDIHRTKATIELLTPRRPVALGPADVLGAAHAGNELADEGHRFHRVDYGTARNAGKEAAEGSGEDLFVTGLAQRIKQCKPETRGASVLVCALESGCDSSAAALEIARTLASGDRTILVNCTDHGPGHDRPIEGGDGLGDLLAGCKSFAEVIHRDPGSRLLVLPAGRLAKTGRIEEDLRTFAIDVLTAAYDYIVFDGAPLSDGDGSLMLAGSTDVTVLVASDNARNLGTLSIDKLVDAGAQNVQLVTERDRPITVTPWRVEARAFGNEDEGHRLHRVDYGIPRNAGKEAADAGSENVHGTGLAQRIKQCKPEMRGASVLVCGLERGSCSSAAALEIARTLAASDRAILVKLYDQGPDPDRSIDGGGLGDLLAGRTSFAEVIRRDPGSRLFVLPAGRLGKRGRIEEEHLNLAIDVLMATYDYVILDGAPLADEDGSLALVGWTDVTVLIASDNTKNLGTLAIDMLVDAGAVNVQLVMARDDTPMTVTRRRAEARSV